MIPRRVLAPSLPALLAAAVSVSAATGPVPALAPSGTPAVPREAVRSATAVRRTGSVAIDGRLTEQAWERAEVLSDFTQRTPSEGHAATERTEVRVLFDDDALYIGFRAYDAQPSGITRRIARRDTDVQSDEATILLDPHHDHRTGVQFTATPSGSRMDGAISNDATVDFSWDAVWDVATTVDEEGWTAEFRIPLSQLRFPAAASRIWGFNVARVIRRKNEESHWQAIPRAEAGLVSRFGHLTGIDGLATQSHLELLPYASSRGDVNHTVAAGNPFTDGHEATGSAGLDLKWGLATNFTLDAAINPDFGQVEVDPAVVNLTAFETFYQEKRPFFIEGSQLFSNFGRNGLAYYVRANTQYPSLVYSRRIGRAPQLTVPGDFVDTPTSTTILGASKLTGRTASGWGLIVLDAVTGREFARAAEGLGRARSEVEPLTNYVAARAQRDIGGKGGVGMLVTSVSRQLRTDALKSLLSDQASVAGVDGYTFFDSGKRWVISGSLAASQVHGSESAISRYQRSSARYFQRPDTTHVSFDPTRRSLSGWTGQVGLNRRSGQILVDASAWAISPGFDSNDIGYSPNADRIGAHGTVWWRKVQPDRWTRSRYIMAQAYQNWNFGHDVVGQGTVLQSYIVYPNYWSSLLYFNRFGETLSDDLTRGGPMSRRSRGWTSLLQVASDPRKVLSATVRGIATRTAIGGWTYEVTPSITLRPSTRLVVSAGPYYLDDRTVLQYVGAVADSAATATYGRRYLFSTIDRTEISMEARVSAIFTPKASLEVYFQPLVTAGHYWGFKELPGAGSFPTTRYGLDAGSIAYDAAQRRYTVDPDGAGPAGAFRLGNPDFNYRSARLNAVFRWEWRLGSTLYAVWTQARESVAGDGRFDLGRDLRQMTKAPADNVFMLKVAYWLNR